MPPSRFQQGIVAARKRWSPLVSLHVTLGFMLGVCLTTFSVSIYYNMETRCFEEAAFRLLSRGYLTL